MINAVLRWHLERVLRKGKGDAKAGRKIMNDNLGDEFEGFFTAASRGGPQFSDSSLSYSIL